MIDVVPSAPESGASGSQVSGNTFTVIPITAAIPSVSEIVGLYSNPQAYKEFGRSEVLARVIHAHLESLNRDLLKANAQISKLESDLFSVRTELAASNTREEVLKERIKNAKISEAISQCMNIFGAILIGLSVDLFKGGSFVAGVVCSSVGSLLIILSILALVTRISGGKK